MDPYSDHAHQWHPLTARADDAPTGPSFSEGNLGRAILDFVVECCTELVERYAPGFKLPRVFGGFLVDDATVPELMYLLTLLSEAGCHTIAGTTTDEAIERLARQVVGGDGSPFTAHRLAEVLAQYGPWQANSIVSQLHPGQRRSVASVMDTRDFVKSPSDAMPRNYIGVHARAEWARRELGLHSNPADWRLLIAQTRALIQSTGSGFFDDSVENAGRYDIYSPALYLVLEPFHSEFGGDWESGARSCLALVESVLSRSGSAVPWGRSSGLLSLCLTIELTAMTQRHPQLTASTHWPTFGATAFDHCRQWFSAGLATTHQYRSTYAYRGPARRLQMTLDCLSKLAGAIPALLNLCPRTAGEPWPLRDQVHRFDAKGSSAVWSFRSPTLEFVVPLLGTTVSDYLPAPLAPGTFEVPVDSAIASFVPVAYVGGTSHVPLGPPVRIEHGDARLTAEYVSWAPLGVRRPPEPSSMVPGIRRVEYSVDGRTVHIRESFSFQEPPEMVAVQVTDAMSRPLQVQFQHRKPHGTDTVVPVGGMKDHRSYYGELRDLHQLEMPAATEYAYQLSITPMIRVASSAVGHPYDASLYGRLTGVVHEVQLPRSERDGLASLLRQIDVVHMHWPERVLPKDISVHASFIAALKSSGTPVLWTQHNLHPHSTEPEWEEIYSLWARTADAVIHHSRWGLEKARSRLPYREATHHAVLPHGHFGDLEPAGIGETPSDEVVPNGGGARSLRLGIIGAPRDEKDVQLAMEAMTRSVRDDVELVVLSGGSEDVPVDQRVRWIPYEYVSRTAYAAWLRSFDALVMPFRTGDLLTTGTVADAIGAGLPVLASDWPFLREYLGDTQFYYGRTAWDLAQCIDGLTHERLTAARAALVGRRTRFSWEATATQHAQLLEQVVTGREQATTVGMADE